jgi:hypothetical protein
MRVFEIEKELAREAERPADAIGHHGAELELDRAIVPLR